ncbi:MAG: hypothetical protein GX641_00125 [Mollicutes bacterium]|nr:hypothetical protein [Mollicutes bacterium]
MILILLGTQDKSFHRLLEEISRLLDNGKIKDQVIVQAGYTKYIDKRMKIFDFINPSDLKKYVLECNYLITHGGVGSIMDGIQLKKKIIAIPRLKEYHEHDNDHQLEIIKEFNDLGYIVGLNSVQELEKGLKIIKTFKPKVFKSNTGKIIKIIKEYID